MDTRLRRGGGLDPAWHAAQLASLAASTRRLLATVDELNDMARLELGEALDLDVDDVDLGALTRAVADEVAQGSGAQSRGAASIAVAAPAAPLRVAGDRGRLARVLQNIIGNAVKYSRGGAPVAVEVRREGAATLVVVRDRGVGIPADELPCVFERFYRASTARGIKGSGIGLSGAKAIVETPGPRGARVPGRRERQRRVGVRVRRRGGRTTRHHAIPTASLDATRYASGAPGGTFRHTRPAWSWPRLSWDRRGPGFTVPCAGRAVCAHGRGGR